MQSNTQDYYLLAQVLSQPWTPASIEGKWCADYRHPMVKNPDASFFQKSGRVPIIGTLFDLRACPNTNRDHTITHHTIPQTFFSFWSGTKIGYESCDCDFFKVLQYVQEIRRDFLLLV